MNLDDLNFMKQIDSANMIREIQTLPQQLEAAWVLGNQLDLPRWRGIKNILIAGMGGSAIGADLFSAYAAPLCPLPVVVHRDYDLPAWANGPETLVIVSSHSGNTEETLSAFKAAQLRNCSILIVCTGGKLAEEGAKAGYTVWTFNHQGQPRAAVGFSFGLLTAVFYRLGLVPDPSQELAEAVERMTQQQQLFEPEVPVVHNPSKRMAGQLYGRWVVVFGSGYLAPVARRWKGQISEVAKAWGQFEFLPEADHNTLTGLTNPSELIAHSMVLFLRSTADHPRNQMRAELTRELFMVEGYNTDIIMASGENPMAQIWTALHYGDYVTYYLAMAYGTDPTPIGAIQELKAAMKN